MVKVNAPVDEGIAELVAALSEFPEIETLESCQGDHDKPAFVIFRLGSWRDCGSFLFDKLLRAMDSNLRADVSASIIGYGVTHCLGRLSLSPEAVSSLADTVRAVRKSVCSGGNPHTSRGNY
jgi:hypothetical protein